MSLYFSPDEHEIIVGNLKKIEEYAKEEILPRLRENEIVRSRVNNNWFGVKANGEICFTKGGLWLYFDEEKHPNDNVFHSWTYATALLLDWEEFKHEISRKLDSMDQERKKILDFVI